MLPTADLEHILTETGGLFQSLKGKSIFLTGGTGFFGKWLAESFAYVNEQLSLNARLTILSRNPDKFLEQYPCYRSAVSVDFVKGDILDFEFPDGDYEYIIHAATESDAQKNIENLLLMIDTITMGTRRVLEFAKEKKVQSFLFTSSGAVYGKQPSTVTHIKEDESFPLDITKPVAAYAEGKRLAEVFCSIYHSYYQLPVKIARCFAFVGPYLPLDKHFAIGNFILNALHKEDIVIKGDGTPYRSYLYAADLMVWLWTILLNGKDNTCYNVGSDEDLSLGELAHVVKEIQPGIGVQIIGAADKNKPVERYVPDINLAKQTLGLKVKISLKEAIEKTMSFYGSI
jgi:dTDP-glucose 4,6-dehydratase